MVLRGAKEAYELSFVAVPAQPRAATHKTYGFVKPVEEKAEETPEIKNNDNEKMDARFINQRLRNAESFLNSERED